MKNTTILLSILFILLQFTSCKRVPLSTGDMATETRQLEHFSKLKLYDNVNVTIVPCDTFGIEITAGKNLLENISTDVKNDTLIIRNRNLCNWLRDYESPINATIYLKKLYCIYYESVGDLICNEPMKDLDNNFNLRINGGSGNINLELYYNNITIYSLHGCCIIDIDGYANKSNILNYSYGILDAGDLQSRYVSVSSNSSNDTYIHCTSILSARLMSIGNIYCHGVPDSVSVKKSLYAKGNLIPY